MIRPLLAVVSRLVLRDTDTDQMSVVQIFEGVQAERFPILLPEIAFLVLWEREPTDPAQVNCDVRILIDEQELARQTVDLDFRDRLKNRLTIRAPMVPIPQPGRLHFRATIGDTVAEYTISVTARDGALTVASQATQANPAVGQGEG